MFHRCIPQSNQSISWVDRWGRMLHHGLWGHLFPSLRVVYHHPSYDPWLVVVWAYPQCLDFVLDFYLIPCALAFSSTLIPCRYRLGMGYHRFLSRVSRCHGSCIHAKAIIVQSNQQDYRVHRVGRVKFLWSIHWVMLLYHPCFQLAYQSSFYWEKHED